MALSRIATVVGGLLLSKGARVSPVGMPGSWPWRPWPMSCGRAAGPGVTPNLNRAGRGVSDPGSGSGPPASALERAYALTALALPGVNLAKVA